MPLSWRHYVLGLAHLGRRRASDHLMIAAAVRVAQAPKDDYRAWTRELGSVAD